MAYELTNLLMKCELEDFYFLAKQTDSYINFSSDEKLNGYIKLFESDQSNRNSKIALSKFLEKEIRYAGSSDVAFAFRKYFKSEDVAGVSIYEIIDDVSKVLKVKQKFIGNAESQLERLTKAVVEKTFLSLKEEEQRELLEKAGVNKAAREEFFKKFKDNKTRFLPLLLSIVGPEVTATLIQGIAITALAAFIGREAAKKLIEALATKFPWWAQWLGPIVWGLSLSWTAYDIQGGANRKTIPILVYLGIVGLRDGPEDGDDFWEEN